MKMTRHTSSAAAMQEIQHKQIDKIFGDRTAPTEVQLWETKINANCDIHGRRGSGGSVRSLSQRRDSTASSVNAGQTREPVSKRDSIGSTILLNNTTGTHWKNSFKRDSTPATTSGQFGSLHNLASDLRSSMARIDSLDNPAADRSNRATTPARTQVKRDNSSSFSNGVRRTSMPVLNQR